MPLKPGKDKATIAENTEEMIHAGHPPDQAAAAAHRKARESQAKPKGRPPGGKKQGNV